MTVCEWRALKIKMESADRAGIDFVLNKMREIEKGLNIMVKHTKRKEGTHSVSHVKPPANNDSESLLAISKLQSSITAV